MAGLVEEDLKLGVLQALTHEVVVVAIVAKVNREEQFPYQQEYQVQVQQHQQLGIHTPQNKSKKVKYPYDEEEDEQFDVDNEEKEMNNQENEEGEVANEVEETDNNSESEVTVPAISDSDDDSEDRTISMLKINMTTSSITILLPITSSRQNLIKWRAEPVMIRVAMMKREII